MSYTDRQFNGNIRHVLTWVNEKRSSSQNKQLLQRDNKPD